MIQLLVHGILKKAAINKYYSIPQELKEQANKLKTEGNENFKIGGIANDSLRIKCIVPCL